MEQEILDYMKYGLVGVLWDAMTETETKKKPRRNKKCIQCEPCIGSL